MPTYTPNLGLAKPLVGDPTDEDLWGDQLNANADILDAASGPPVGAPIPWLTGTPPTNYVMLNGQAISRTTYAPLFALWGVTFGTGDGSTTFNVPDLRGRTIFGSDTMGASAAGRLTTASGFATGTTYGETGGSQLLQQHTHAVTDPGHSHTNSGVVTNIPGTDTAQTSGGANTQTSTNVVNPATTGISIQNTGGGNSQNMPPGMIGAWITRAR